MEKEGHHTKVDVSMDKVIEEDHIMSITIAVTIEWTIFRNMQNYRGQDFRDDIEEIIKMIILEEGEVGLGKDNIQIISEGMIVVVVVGLDQV